MSCRTISHPVTPFPSCRTIFCPAHPPFSDLLLLRPVASPVLFCCHLPFFALTFVSSCCTISCPVALFPSCHAIFVLPHHLLLCHAMSCRTISHPVTPFPSCRTIFCPAHPPFSDLLLLRPVASPVLFCCHLPFFALTFVSSCHTIPVPSPPPPIVSPRHYQLYPILRSRSVRF